MTIGEHLELELRADVRRAFIDGICYGFGREHFDPIWGKVTARMAARGMTEDTLYYDLEDDAFRIFGLELRMNVRKQASMSKVVNDGLESSREWLD